MLKLFGAGLTMFSCFAAGCLICAEMKKRIHILEELRRMTVMLSAEIGYANTMLDEAFGSIAKRVSQPLSDFLVHVQEKMQKGEEANLGVIFEKQLEMDLKGTALKESDHNDKQKLDCDGDGLFTGGRAENVREENSVLFEGLASNRPLQGQIRPQA